MSHPNRYRGVLLVAALLLAVPAFGQPSISVDVAGPSGLPPQAVLGTTPGPGPVPAPVVSCPLGFLLPGIVNRPEVDALSNGRDPILRPDSSLSTWGTKYCFTFSVDEWANGDPAAPAPPNVFTEGSLGNLEASADLQLTCVGPGMPLAPIGPAGPVMGHTSWRDGDGFAPFGGPGLGLAEPDFPGFGFPDTGDNVDAVDFRRFANNSQVFFSLDARYVDPLEGAPINTRTALANGVLPGDVLMTICGGAGFAVYAPAAALGLGRRDDLDALILWDNGDGVYTPSTTPFDWAFGAGTDMLLFSVRRGSPLIGTPDAFFGARIQEGDLLTTTPAGPGIFFSAESLGLGTTRSGTAFFTNYSDDLDAASAEFSNLVP